MIRTSRTDTVARVVISADTQADEVAPAVLEVLATAPKLLLIDLTQATPSAALAAAVGGSQAKARRQRCAVQVVPAARQGD